MLTWFQFRAASLIQTPRDRLEVEKHSYEGRIIDLQKFQVAGCIAFKVEISFLLFLIFVYTQRASLDVCEKTLFAFESQAVDERRGAVENADSECCLRLSALHVLRRC